MEKVKVKAASGSRGIILSVMKKNDKHRDIVAEVAAEVFSDWSSLFGKANIQSERAVAEVSNAEIMGRGLNIRHILIERGKEKQCLEEFRKEAGIAKDEFAEVLKVMRDNEGGWIEYG